MVTADKRAAILAKAELLAGRSLGDSGDDLAEMAVQRACAYCNRPDVPEEREQAVAAPASSFVSPAASQPFWMAWPRVQMSPPTRKARRQSRTMGELGALALT